MIASCTCQHCCIPIEFDAEQSGGVLACPNCGKETTLNVIRKPQPAPKLTEPLKTPKSQSGGRRIPISLMGVSALLAISIGANILMWKRIDKEVYQESSLHSQISDIKQQLDDKQKALLSALQSNVAQANKAIMDTVCGIYEIQAGPDRILKIELRSDGNSISSALFGDGGQQELNKVQSNWKLDGDIVEISNRGKFKIEGDDLIDSKGNRWLRTR